MTDNSMAIAVFCSTLAATDIVKPLEPSKWQKVAETLMQIGKQPLDMLEFSHGDFRQQMGMAAEEAERMSRLIDRSAALTFEIDKYESRGIHIVTRADKTYPRKLKKALGAKCTPLFYYAGNLKLLNDPCIGFVGSRTISPEDEDFTRRVVKTCIRNKYSIVSGGAKGVDSISADEGMESYTNIIEFVSDSMNRKLKDAKLLQAMQDERVLIMSEVQPDAGFTAGMAMARNKYIYIQSNATVVIRSDKDKGGTWTGARECLKHEWVPVLCRNKQDYPGNMALIEMGAYPIDESWDGSIPPKQKVKLSPSDEKQEFGKQMMMDGFSA